VTEVEESDTIASKVFSCKFKIDELFAVMASASVTSPSSAVATPPLNTSKPRLPKLTLPKFSGDVTKWTTFWDSFKSAVNETSQLTSIDKFNYLYSLLEGNALRCVKGLQLSADNYATALELLKQRFGKKQQIITAHMEELLKLSDKLSDNANERTQTQSLRTKLHCTSEDLRPLKSVLINTEVY